jgi:TetR/AcrR family transcriptional repressor of nem operon
MRYTPEHKAVARQKLIRAGGALAKKSGFNNTGIDALAAAADMTTGAFYSQFRSKQAFLTAIVEHELAKITTIFADKDEQGLKQVLAWYLSPHHVQYPEDGCLLPTLGVEVGRADDHTRLLFEQQLEPLLSILQTATADKTQAWTLLAQAIGGVILARAVLSEEKQHEILTAIKKTGMNILNAEAGEVGESVIIT